jgi:hypothetical protein
VAVLSNKQDLMMYMLQNKEKFLLLTVVVLVAVAIKPVLIEMNLMEAPAGAVTEPMERVLVVQNHMLAVRLY